MGWDSIALVERLAQMPIVDNWSANDFNPRQPIFVANEGVHSAPFLVIILSTQNNLDWVSSSHTGNILPAQTAGCSFGPVYSY